MIPGQLFLFHGRLPVENVESIFCFGLIGLNTFFHVASLGKSSSSFRNLWGVTRFFAEHFLLDGFQLSHFLLVFGDFIASICEEVSIDFADVFDFTRRIQMTIFSGSAKRSKQIILACFWVDDLLVMEILNASSEILERTKSNG